MVDVTEDGDDWTTRTKILDFTVSKVSGNCFFRGLCSRDFKIDVKVLKQNKN